MALTCKLNDNILRTSSCGYNLPKVTDLYLANYDDVTSSAVGGAEGEQVTAITLADSANWLHVEPAKDSTTFTDELVVEDNGNKYRTHTLTFSVNGKYDAKMRENLDALSLGRYFAVIKTADGGYLAMGRITGVEATVATLNGGGDTNGIEITLAADTTESAVPLADEVVTELLSKVKK